MAFHAFLFRQLQGAAYAVKAPRNSLKRGRFSEKRGRFSGKHWTFFAKRRRLSSAIYKLHPELLTKAEELFSEAMVKNT